MQPGELVSIGEDGIRSRRVVEGARKAFCVFEYIYFARPDSRMNGQALQVARGRMGEILWREAPVEADIVIAVPDSGNPAARGLARAAGLPQDDGFVKNRYVARTFIQPGQELRKHGLRLKFNPLPEVIAGRRLIVVDDSIVRGNTTRQIVAMLRDAGAREVHMRISAPPIKHPCHYGIDMSTREEMIAHNRTTEEVAAELGCDSLHYLSLAGVYEAVGGPVPTHPAGASPTATPASAASTRSTAPARPTASTRWRSRPGPCCRSCGRRWSAAAPLPIAVLVSGTGTNLQALLDTVHGQEAEVVAVASNVAGAPALERAAARGVSDGRVRARGVPRSRARAIGRWPIG